MAQQSIAITTLPDGKICDFNELPRSKLRGIKPPLADSHGPASLAGSYSWSVWMAWAPPRTPPIGHLDDAVAYRLVHCLAAAHIGG